MKKISLALGIGLSACVATTGIKNWKQTGWGGYFRDTPDKAVFVTDSLNPYITLIGSATMLLPPKFVDPTKLNDLCGKTSGACAKPDLRYVAVVEPKSPTTISDLLNPNKLTSEQLEFAADYLYEQFRYVLRDSSRVPEIREMKATVASLIAAERFMAEQSVNMGKPIMNSLLERLASYVPVLPTESFTNFDALKADLERKDFAPQHIAMLGFGYLLISFDSNFESVAKFLASSSNDSIIQKINSAMSSKIDPASKVQDLFKSKQQDDNYVCELADKSELSYTCSINDLSASIVSSSPLSYAIPAKSSTVSLDSSGRSFDISTKQTYEYEQAQRILRIIRDAPESLEHLATASTWTFKRYVRSFSYQISGDVVYARNNDLFVIFEFSKPYREPQTLQNVSVYNRKRDGKRLDIKYSISRVSDLAFEPNLPTTLQFLHRPRETRYWDGFSPKDSEACSRKDPSMTLCKDISAIATPAYTRSITDMITRIYRQIPKTN